MGINNVQLAGVACIEGEKVQIVVRVMDYISGKYVDVFVPREQLNPQTINKIIVNNNGVCQNAKAVCNSLIKSVDILSAEGCEVKVSNFLR